MRRANYEIEEHTADRVVIRDVGPWGHYLTVTNAAEAVVAEMLTLLDGRRLFYYDSDGLLSEILIAGGKFAGFS